LYYDTAVYLYTYMFLYNISLTLLFWVLFNVIITEFKSLYSFSNMSFNSFFIALVSVLLLSMAGVPPFIGFFSKLFIITLLLNNSFFLLYMFFFVILFLGLYFYVQNLRFLHSTNKQTLNYPYIHNERNNIVFYYAALTILFIIIFGVFYIDDILLYFSWILV
jgi:NADH:ubiquinone oxidoreductase subunit 2 (subunit N)